MSFSLAWEADLNSDTACKQELQTSLREHFKSPQVNQNCNFRETGYGHTKNGNTYSRTAPG